MHPRAAWLAMAMHGARQSFNPTALRALARVARRPSLMVPHLECDDVAALDYAALRSRGFRAVVFDKDATLTLPYSYDVPRASREAIAAAQAHFGAGQVVCLSNSAGGPDDADGAAARQCEASLRMRVVRHRTKKPGGIDELLSSLDEPASPLELVVVGDRLLTDVVFGNLHGALTVRTRALLDARRARDNRAAAIARRAESAVLAAGRAGYLGGRARWQPAPHALLPRADTRRVVSAAGPAAADPGGQ